MLSLGGPVVCLGGLKLGQLLECGKDREQQETQNLLRFGQAVGASSLLVMPNYAPPSLSPPRGWVAELPATGEFCQDAFAGTEKFGIFLMVEVRTTEMDLAKAREALLKTVPLGDGPAPPTPESDLSDGWVPALNGQGSFCGLYKAEEVDHDTSERWGRFYVVVHSTLPESTLLAFEELDVEAHVQNQRAREKFVETLDTARAEAEGTAEAKKVWDVPSTLKPVTYGDVFGAGRHMERMRALAVENAKRLACMVAECFQADLFTTHRGDMGLWRDGKDFEDARTTVSQALLKDVDALARALSWWPSGVPVCSFHTTPPQKKGDPPYPLGAVLALLQQE